jgi:hypothetical protein
MSLFLKPVRRTITLLFLAFRLHELFRLHSIFYHQYLVAQSVVKDHKMGHTITKSPGRMRSMEYTLNSLECTDPCAVTVDPENGIYTIKTFDTSGRQFNEPMELVAWIKKNWEPQQFEDPSEYQKLLRAIHEEIS